MSIEVVDENNPEKVLFEFSGKEFPPYDTDINFNGGVFVVRGFSMSVGFCRFSNRNDVNKKVIQVYVKKEMKKTEA